MSEVRDPGAAPTEHQPTAPSRSNAPLIAIFVLAGLILLGTFAYAFMMTMPASMPGMGH